MAGLRVLVAASEVAGFAKTGGLADVAAALPRALARHGNQTAVVMPYLILTLQSVLEGMDLSVEEAARNVGASFFTTLRRIVLPIAAPGVAAGTMLVFILCMNAYATPVLLGGSGLTMMAPALYDQITKASNWPFGAALSFLLMYATFAAIALRAYFSRDKAIEGHGI